MLLLLLLLGLAGNHEQKMCQIEQKLWKETKNVYRSKKCAREKRLYKAMQSHIEPHKAIQYHNVPKSLYKHFLFELEIFLFDLEHVLLMIPRQP